MARPKIAKKFHKVSITLTISPSILKEVKSLIKEQGVSLSSFMESSLAATLQQHKK
jgi:hypothetical protein